MYVECSRKDYGDDKSDLSIFAVSHSTFCVIKEFPSERFNINVNKIMKVFHLSRSFNV